MFSGQVKNCFDSHVHWHATGADLSRLNLRHLRSLEDLKSLKIRPEHFQGDWLLGFGWDDNLFVGENCPDKTHLDKCFPNFPVAFTRIDGHAIWVNSKALQICAPFDPRSLLSGEIQLDKNKKPTGIFLDRAIHAIEKQIPEPASQNVRRNLLIGQEVFHKAGFTHIRDLTCDETQWNEIVNLIHFNELQLHVDQFISADNPDHFFKCVDLAIRARKSIQSDLINVAGIKVYFDGALGSEGALISRCYCGRPNYFGLQLLSESQLSEMMLVCSEKNLDLAIHVIGDEAAHRVVQLAQTFWKHPKSPKAPKLHLEHGQLLRFETIEQLKNLNVSIHLQPCHWLSDKRWLKNKIGDLVQYAFQWNKLEHCKIEFDFGSDSPIESTSFIRNMIAIQDAAQQGILPIQNPHRYHSHLSSRLQKACWTHFEEGVPTQIIFNGHNLNL